MDTTKNKFNFSLSLSRAQQSSLEKQFDGIALVQKTRKGFSIAINEDKFSSEVELNVFREALAALEASYKKKIDLAYTNTIEFGLTLLTASLAMSVLAVPIGCLTSLGPLLIAGMTISGALPMVGWIVGISVLATLVLQSGISVFIYVSEKNEIREQFLLEISDLIPKAVPSIANRYADLNYSGNVLKRSQSEKNLSLLANKVIKYGAMFRSVSDSALNQSSTNIESNLLKRF